MPESGLPIRVYEEHDMWHVDYGEGETEDHTGRERPRPTRSHRPKSAPWSSRNNDLVAMLTSLDRFDHAGVVGGAPAGAEISVALSATARQPGSSTRAERTTACRGRRSAEPVGSGGGWAGSGALSDA